MKEVQQLNKKQIKWATYFNNLNIEISHKEDIQPPELEDKSFYKIYLPEEFTLEMTFT